MTNYEGYPQSVNLIKQVYGHGGVRVYRVTKSEAKSIAKEFQLLFQRNPVRADYFYVRVSKHGVLTHVVFSVDKQKK